MRRSPVGPRATTVPPSASRQVGHSAAASAWAMEPPQVPALRMARCAMCGAAGDSSGACCATSGLPSISVCVVSAPMRNVPPCTPMPRSASRPLMSISSLGSDRRMLSEASSDCPPAISRASSPCSCSSEITCSIDRGLT